MHTKLYINLSLIPYPMNPRVSIIIINWNGWRDTIECLESLYQIDYPDYTIILVDNNSTNDSLYKIKEYLNGNIKVKSDFFDYNPHNKPLKFKEYRLKDLKSLKMEKNSEKLTIIKNDQNSGFAKGNNIGITYAINFLKSEYVLLLNNDTVVDKNFLNELILTAKKHEKFGLLSPLIYEYDKPNGIQYQGEKINWNTGRIVKKKIKNQYLEPSDVVCGASMLIKKEVVNKVGLLPTDYFMLWEDNDYSIKITKAGFNCGYAIKSKIWHKGSVSIGRVSSPLRIKYSIRNRIIFWKKYSNKKQYLTFLFFLVLIHIPLNFCIGFLRTNKKKEFVSFFLDGYREGLSYKI
jgi:GT2 family glycosyltransferase